jgi:hypothetical protein
LPGGGSLSRLLRRRRGDSAQHPWTDAEDELVRALSAADAVERTGRTPAAVARRRRILHVERSNAERDEEIIACWAARETLEPIGARYGLTRQRVSQVLVEHGAPRGKPGRRPKRGVIV